MVVLRDEPRRTRGSLTTEQDRAGEDAHAEPGAGLDDRVGDAEVRLAVSAVGVLRAYLGGEHVLRRRDRRERRQGRHGGDE